MATIEVSDLFVRHGEVTAVSGLSFSGEKGQVLGLLGPNGAGKTSTVETLEGFLQPSGGSVRVLGCDPIRDRARLVGRMGVMLQEGGCYPGLGAADALRLFASYYDNARSPSELLERVGLGRVANTPWKRLSGGEKKRLDFALALVGRPRVLFLDEPTAGADAEARLLVRELIRELRADGATILLTTHDLEEAHKIADHLVIIDHGRQIANGSPAQLTLSETAGQFDFTAVPGIATDELARLLGHSVSEPRPGEYVVHAVPAPSIIATLAGWLSNQDIQLTSLRTQSASLEDAFLNLTRNVVQQ